MAKAEKLHPQVKDDMKFMSKINLTQVKLLTLSNHDDFFICRLFGVSMQQWRAWRDKYPDLKDALDGWKEIATRNVERSLYEKATGFERIEEKIFQNEVYEREYDEHGRMTKEIKKFDIQRVPITVKDSPDTPAIKMWLTNKKGREWKDKTQVEHEVGSLADLISRSRQEQVSKQITQKEKVLKQIDDEVEAMDIDEMLD